MRRQQVDYICKYMMQTDWTLDQCDYDPLILFTFDLCQSKLELMYLLGLMSAYSTAYYKWTGGFPDLGFLSFTYKGVPAEGITFQSPWFAWEYYGGGFASSMTIVPQAPFGNNYHHDFLVFTANDNGEFPGTPYMAIEIDGYAMHNERRDKDHYRDNLCKYPVIRLREEVSNPATWFAWFMYFYSTSHATIENWLPQYYEHIANSGKSMPPGVEDQRVNDDLLIDIGRKMGRDLLDWHHSQDQD